MNIENKILQNLIYNQQYTTKVLPFIEPDYFKEQSSKEVFKIIQNYINKYLNRPTIEAIKIELDNSNLTQNIYQECINLCKVLNFPEKFEDLDWLVDTTEKFCQDAALTNAIISAMSIIDGDEQNLGKGSIEKIITNALSVSFSTEIGHDYLEDYIDRYEYYTLPQHKIPFSLDSFNRITKNGVSKKTLNIFMAACVHPDTKITIRYKKKD